MKKQILGVCLMFLTLSAFANKSKESVTFKKNIVVETMTEFDSGFTATCSVTIVNSNTGATRTVQGVGSGATPSAALSNCGANAMRTAFSLVAKLNHKT